MKRGSIQRRDPVTEAVYLKVRDRDRGCVGPRLGLAGSCGGPLELDHVRAGGMGLRSRSTVDNLVTLCRDHHRYKTMNGRLVRPLLLSWLGSHPVE